MAEDSSRWLQVSGISHQAELHLPSHNEPVDVVWLSGSAIAVAPRNPPPLIDYQPVEHRPVDLQSGNDGNYEVVNSEDESDATIEYQFSHQDETVTVTESELEDTEFELGDTESEATGEDESQQIVANMDGNSIIIIQHETPGEQLAQEPNVVTVPENPTAGVENPIIRLENPDYEPETCKSSNPEPTRVSGKRSYSVLISEEEDDGQTCPVCFEVWTNAGEHRLTALKCGHLFGKSCIIRWLSKEKKKYCPQCNKKAHLNDLRELYATKLTALDATERTRLEKELEDVKDQKRKLELELMRCNLNIEMYKEQLETLKLKISQLTNDSDSSRKSSGKTESKPPSRVIKFYLEKTFEIKEGCCRVCAYDSLTNTLIVSHQTRNQLFTGYGIKRIKKIGTDYIGNNFLYLHSKPMRDLCLHPITPNIILTVSFDKSAKLTDLSKHNEIHIFKAEYPLWSCCWDTDDSNYFYAGAANGTVYVFDVRSPSTHVACLTPISDFSTVVSVRYAPSNLPFKGGVICCRLNSIIMYEKTAPKEYNPVPLTGLMGRFFSLSFDPSTRHILASCRPSEESSRVRHFYCELSGSECRKVYTFCGGTRQTLLSRSCFVTVNNETLVAVFQENTNSIDLWSTSTGKNIQSIPVSDEILDFAAIQVENRHLIGTVSDSFVRFYETAENKV